MGVQKLFDRLISGCSEAARKRTEPEITRTVRSSGNSIPQRKAHNAMVINQRGQDNNITIKTTKQFSRLTINQFGTANQINVGSSRSRAARAVGFVKTVIGASAPHVGTVWRLLFLAHMSEHLREAIELAMPMLG